MVMIFNKNIEFHQRHIMNYIFDKFEIIDF